jgi:hypothetical protein
MHDWMIITLFMLKKYNKVNYIQKNEIRNN